METRRPRALLITAVAVAVLALVAVVALSSSSDDADAADTTRLNTLWAVVNADGTLARGKGATGSRNVSDGRYEVKFGQNVTTCAYSATLDANSGFAFVSLRDSSIGQREVGITTLDRGGVVRDTKFHLIVQC